MWRIHLVFKWLHAADAHSIYQAVHRERCAHLQLEVLLVLRTFNNETSRFTAHR